MLVLKVLLKPLSCLHNTEMLLCDCEGRMQEMKGNLAILGCILRRRLHKPCGIAWCVPEPHQVYNQQSRPFTHGKTVLCVALLFWLIWLAMPDLCIPRCSFQCHVCRVQRSAWSSETASDPALPHTLLSSNNSSSRLQMLPVRVQPVACLVPLLRGGSCMSVAWR